MLFVIFMYLFLFLLIFSQKIYLGQVSMTKFIKSFLITYIIRSLSLSNFNNHYRKTVNRIKKNKKFYRCNNLCELKKWEYELIFWKGEPVNGQIMSDYCHGLWCWQIPSIKIYYTLTELLSTRTIIRTQFSHSVMSNSVIPWVAGCQASLSKTNSQNLLTLMYIQLMMPSNHLISVTPFSCLQSFPTSGSFPMSQVFTSGGQSIGASALASVLPMNIQDHFLSLELLCF